MSQWRSSWLSREGVAAVLSYPAMMAFGAGLWLGQPGPLLTLSGLASVILAVVTVCCTGMIYASLKPIPGWNSSWVVPNYLAFALATGGALLMAVTALTGGEIALMAKATVVAVAAAWLLKLGYWRHLDHGPARATSGSATGLQEYGIVRLLESPHTAENYLLKEMGFKVARKHADKLRRIALIGAVAAVSLLMAAVNYSGAAAGGWTLLGAVSLMVSVLIERWLFFAEARHAVNLYYGAESV
jgi:DMSO reductase anchor subunit